jgi:signal transduction histidine kinase
LKYQPDCLQLEVEDHGAGFVAPAGNNGIGLVAMRERAELLGGTIEFMQPAEGGTLVRLTVPRSRLESANGT